VTVAALVLASIGACPTRSVELRHVVLGALGGGAFAAAGISEFEALSRAPAATVVLLVFLAPVWIAIASWLLWRTAVGWIRCGLVMLVLTGTALLVATPTGQPLDQGAVALALVASVMAAAFFLVMGRLVQDLPARQVGFLLAVGAALCACLVSGDAALAEFGSFPRGWYAGSIGVITALSLGLLCAGLGQTSPLSGSAIAGAEPVVAALLSWLVLGEALAPLQLVGAMGVLAGVTLLSMQSLRPAHLASAAPLVKADRRHEDYTHHDVLPKPLDPSDEQAVREDDGDEDADDRGRVGAARALRRLSGRAQGSRRRGHTRPGAGAFQRAVLARAADVAHK
jgi:drug/metabolite transporter (DMT)-like permease